ncbi:MAG TPA: hypothetical protein VFH83_07760 [Spirochaetia bacterium]|nr:hypothetical protein [Spirochaetia bacterium]
MTSIVCDSCKKVVQGARKDQNFSVFMEKDICIPCREELEDATKRQMLSRRPYTLKDYWTTYNTTLTRMCSRG